MKDAYDCMLGGMPKHEQETMMGVFADRAWDVTEYDNPMEQEEGELEGLTELDELEAWLELFD